MSPEQAMDPRRCTPASDVWSVGVMLYEVLTGALPFEGETMPAVCMAAYTTPHVPVVERRPEVGAELSALVDRCLAKKPLHRFEDAGAVARAFDAIPGLTAEAIGRGALAALPLRPVFGPDDSADPAPPAPPAATAPPSPKPSDEDAALGAPLSASMSEPPAPSRRGLWAAVALLALGGGAALWLGLGASEERAAGSEAAAVIPPPVVTPAERVTDPAEGKAGAVVAADVSDAASPDADVPGAVSPDAAVADVPDVEPPDAEPPDAAPQRGRRRSRRSRVEPAPARPGPPKAAQASPKGSTPAPVTPAPVTPAPVTPAGSTTSTVAAPPAERPLGPGAAAPAQIPAEPSAHVPAAAPARPAAETPVATPPAAQAPSPRPPAPAVEPTPPVVEPKPEASPQPFMTF